MIRVETIRGDFFIRSDRDLISTSLREYGEWAEPEINFLSRFVREGSTVLDVGSCLGTHARAFAEIAGHNGLVVAFEPLESNFDLLDKNIVLSRMSTIVACRAFVDCRDEENMFLRVSSENYGATRRSVERSPDFAPAIALDAFGFGNVSLIKLDIEGGEGRAIHGARKTIETSRPVVFSEINNLQSAADVLNAWATEGYNVWGMLSKPIGRKPFRSGKFNVFGDSLECALLFVPSEIGEISSAAEVSCWPIKSLDDVVTLLLRVPQYARKTEIDSEHYGLPIFARKNDATNLKSDVDGLLRIFASLPEVASRLCEYPAVKFSVDHIEHSLRRPFRTATQLALLELALKNPLFSESRKAKFQRSIAKRNSNDAIARLKSFISEDGSSSRHTVQRPLQFPSALVGSWRSSIIQGVLNDIPLQKLSEADSARIEVIIPVYRGAEETKACITSVLRARCRTSVLVTVIDDCSPEEDLVRYLSEMSAAGYFRLIRNERNVGFVESCNRALANVENRHALLLNSDTVVWNDWVDRLSAHLAHASVGTVTPFSNNATLCSYPQIFHDNEASLELTDQELDLLASIVNDGESVDVPTGVGFCMLISNDCLRRVGAFDVAAFGKGYGEENDFCLRAASLGFRNLHALDVFVRHYGETSFGSGHNERKKNALNVLRSRYPQYECDVQRYRQQDPSAMARQRIDIARILRELRRFDRGTILLISHNRGGGTETHLTDLAAELSREGFGVLIARPNPKSYEYLDITAGGVSGFLNIPAFSLSWDVHAIAQLLAYLNCRAIHIHHLIDMVGFSHVAISEIADAARVPIFITVHDYFFVCPRINLVDASGRYCGLPGSDACNNCIASAGAAAIVGNVADWRAGYLDFLKKAKEVFVPNSDVSERLQLLAPEIRFRVIPHESFEVSVRGDKYEDARPPLLDPEKKKLTVLIIGAIGYAKGSRVLLECADYAKQNSLPIEFVLAGYSDCDASLARAGVRILGPYKGHDELKALIATAKPALAFFPALWPETYSYTLTEALVSGLHPVVFDIGAPAQRLRDLGCGSIIPLSFAENVGLICDALRSIQVRAADVRRVERNSVFEYYYGAGS